MNRKRGSVKRSPKKAAKPVLVVYVLDETGSMGTVKDATVSGFNEYLNGISRPLGVAMTLITFNSDQGARRRHSATPIRDVPRLSAKDYVPAACTPLYDAILEGLDDAEKSGVGHDVIFVVHTDGQENASKRAGRDEVFRRIEEKRKAGWTFVFLGADQDAWQAAQMMGFAAGNVMSYDHSPAATKAAFRSLAVANDAYVKNASMRGSYSSNLVASLTTGGSEPVDLRKKKGWRTP